MILLVKGKDVERTIVEHVAEQLRKGAEIIAVPDGITLEWHDDPREKISGDNALRPLNSEAVANALQKALLTAHPVITNIRDVVENWAR